MAVVLIGNLCGQLSGLVTISIFIGHANRHGGLIGIVGHTVELVVLRTVRDGFLHVEGIRSHVFKGHLREFKGAGIAVFCSRSIDAQFAVFRISIAAVIHSLSGRLVSTFQRKAEFVCIHITTVEGLAALDLNLCRLCRVAVAEPETMFISDRIHLILRNFLSAGCILIVFDFCIDRRACA